MNSRLLGRTIHTLSRPERLFTQFALYHPNLFDLHEQRMLWPIQHSHPLFGHPLMHGIFLPHLRGTGEIALDIGFKHYEIDMEGPDGEWEKMLFPYVGDLLLYLHGRNGPYALNWTVKDRKEAFGERRSGQAKTPVQQKKDRVKAELRATLEETYYSSAGIRTVQVSMDMFDPSLVQNLGLLFPMHALPLRLDESLLEDFSGAVTEAVREGIPPVLVAKQYAADWGTRDQFICKIYQDIWHRHLPVSLLDPILIDQPLSTSGPDALSVYASLFEESAS
ncbi:hypothetical protein [Pseudomonas arcuscaelestis]|nr:hypothetical protein [Pseudomonas arcuscaelestis]